MNTKIIRTTAALVLLAVSSNLYAQINYCKGAVHFESAPVVVNNDWNNFIGSEVNDYPGASKNNRIGRFQDFYLASHPINNSYHRNKPWMTYIASWQMMHMPKPSVNGNIFNYNATNTPQGKAIVRLTGCKAIPLKQKYESIRTDAIRSESKPVTADDDKVGPKSGKLKGIKIKRKVAPKPTRKVSLRHSHNRRPHQHVLPARGKAHRHGKGAVGK